MLDDYTIGVEEEYQLVDPESGAIRSRAGDVLSTDWADALQGELHDTTIEIGTAICRSTAEVYEQLSQRRFQAATTAAAEGLDIVAAGLHPFSGWESHGIRPSARYKAIADRHDRVAREVNIFGMHVHVGVPDRHDRAELMERVRGFIPHLLALSASSPFHEAEDTGFASYRAILWRQFPYTGVPPRFANQEEYDRFIGVLLRGDSIRDRGNIYWSVRPHFSYPTLEFRAMDVCPRATDAATIAGLARLLVLGLAERGLEAPRSDAMSDDLWRAILMENEWHAARYGLDTHLVDPAAPKGKTSARAGIRRLLDQLAPLAAEIGETAVLEQAETLLERGNGADRMRRVHRECNSFKDLVAWLVRETRLGTGFDRRKAQRTGTR